MHYPICINLKMQCIAIQVMSASITLRELSRKMLFSMQVLHEKSRLQIIKTVVFYRQNILILELLNISDRDIIK